MIEDGGYIKFPACLIRDKLALAVVDEQLEVHVIEQTNDPLEYDLVKQSNPIFFVGNDVEMVMSDLSRLTVFEFARKYEHGDFRDE